MNETHAPREFVALACRAAGTHGLWPELVCAIVEQESAWNPWALRYEPAFYDRQVAPQIARGEISDLTESRARAFSWGLMQVMGQVAREHGFSDASLASLCDPAVGLEIGCRVFAAKLAAAEGNVARIIAVERGRESGLPRRRPRPRASLRVAPCPVPHTGASTGWRTFLKGGSEVVLICTATDGPRATIISFHRSKAATQHDNSD